MSQPIDTAWASNDHERDRVLVIDDFGAEHAEELAPFPLPQNMGTGASAANTMRLRQLDGYAFGDEERPRQSDVPEQDMPEPDFGDGHMSQMVEEMNMRTKAQIQKKH